MQDYEKLGAFYLGRAHDLAAGKTMPDPILYDAKDLTTHGVVLGMTGSGKTGLCLTLLEEAAIDGIPAIAIDPKGDLGNLLLTFPNLQPADFRPWIDESEATRNGMAPDQYAAHMAKLWRDGLAKWDQEPQRIEKFSSAVERVIYTPGSNAGVGLAILKSFSAPTQAVLDDADALRERIAASASGLLALLGIEADPIRSREHILLSNLFDRAWRAGRDLDIPSLIRDIQQPPFDKIGVMDLESFFPNKARFDLSMSLNNLLASPSFASWMEGEPLNIRNMLYTPDGRPKLAIVSIAHMSESERMFFVTILLNEILSWTRSQPGTSSLRALIYMDEVYGYFPPTANPPSKTPMLTMLKQARAYGVGCVLATQNPVDLDYKGLSNAGTWFIGRLQTERDKARVIEGLEGASASAGSNFDRQKMEATLAGLDSRIFLMNNVHEDQPVVFHTRWALSYLSGPMTRTQIQTLMADRRAAATQAAGAAAATAATAPSPQPVQEIMHSEKPAAAGSNGRPVAPPEASESFLPINGRIGKSNRLVYRPALLATARLHFVRATYKVDTWQPITLFASISDEVPDDVWSEADTLALEDLELESECDDDAQFAPLPSEMTNGKNYKRWGSDLKSYLYREHTLTIWKSSSPKLYSEAGESDADFRIRLSQKIREERDVEVEKLRAKHAKALSSLKDKLESAQEKVEKEKDEYSSQKMQSMISFGTSILGAVLGRKIVSSTSARSAGTAMRSATRAFEQRGDIGRAKEDVEELQEELEEMEKEFTKEIEEMESAVNIDEIELEELSVRPRKTDIAVTKLALVWLPWRVDSTGIAEPAYSLE